MRIVLLAWLAMGCGTMATESSRRWPVHRKMQDERDARLQTLEALARAQDEAITRLARRIDSLEKQLPPAPAAPAPAAP